VELRAGWEEQLLTAYGVGADPEGTRYYRPLRDLMSVIPMEFYPDAMPGAPHLSPRRQLVAAVELPSLPGVQQLEPAEAGEETPPPLRRPRLIPKWPGVSLCSGPRLAHVGGPRENWPLITSGAQLQ
jgi:hypothetical protein